MGMWKIEEDGLEPVRCVTMRDAEQYVEDRAVEIWSSLRDPNSNAPQKFEGVAWRREIGEGARKPMTATWGNTTWSISYDHD